MKAYCGLALSDSAAIQMIHPRDGSIWYQVHELPRGAAGEPEAVMRAVETLWKSIPEALPEVAAVGLALAPQYLPSPATDGTGDDPEEKKWDWLDPGRWRPLFSPRLADREAIRLLPELTALFAHYPAGPDKAFVILDESPRFYLEVAGPAESEEEEIPENFELAEAMKEPDQTAEEEEVSHSETAFTEERVTVPDARSSRPRTYLWREIPRINIPVEILLHHFGMFEDQRDLERNAALVRDSRGVGFVIGKDEVSVVGITEGVRRPELARAALEGVGALLRSALADVAGEFVVKEIFAAGRRRWGEVGLQIVADLNGIAVEASTVPGEISHGAALLAAESFGKGWERPRRRRFAPEMPSAQREALYVRHTQS